jgi:hypothetical protein
MKLRLSLYKRLFTIEREIPQGSNEDCVCVCYAIWGSEVVKAFFVRPNRLILPLASISSPPSSFSMLEWYCPVLGETV